MMKALLIATTAVVLLAGQGSATLLHSFENSTNGWYAMGDTTLTSQTVGDGAPAVSITDGFYSLMASHTDPSGGADLMRITKNDSAEWAAAMRDSNNSIMSVDLFVPASALGTAAWANVQLRLESSAFTKIATVVDLTKQNDNQVTVELDFSSIAETLRSTDSNFYATLSINAGSTSTRSPVYIDNYQVIPEPATIGMLGLGGLLVALVRRTMVA
jgi:hypothetical protein